MVHLNAYTYMYIFYITYEEMVITIIFILVEFFSSIYFMSYTSLALTTCFKGGIFWLKKKKKRKPVVIF